MIKLIKTIGGHNGAPLECDRCDSKNFAKSGIAWHCTACGTYHPTSLGFDTIKKHLAEADAIMKKFDRAIENLEQIVKK